MTAHVGVLGPFLALPQGSSPRRRRGYLERVFDTFISTGSMDPTLRPMVAESWRLSLASGVSPDSVLPTVDLWTPSSRSTAAPTRWPPSCR